jgi:hypothetical protein
MSELFESTAKKVEILTGCASNKDGVANVFCAYNDMEVQQLITDGLLISQRVGPSGFEIYQITDAGRSWRAERRCFQ